MTNLDSIFQSRDITLPTKVCLVKAMVLNRTWSPADQILLTLPLTKSRLGFNSWGMAELHMSLHGLSPGLSLNLGKDTRQMAKHHPHQSSRDSQPTFFFFFSQLHPFSQDVLITWNCQVLTPQDLVQKASPLWIPSSLLTLSTPCLILFSLHISPWVAFKLLAKWALASPEPSTAPAQPKIWIHIWW